MKNKIILLFQSLLAVSLLGMTACNGGAGPLEAKVATTTVALIPATASSCLAVRQATAGSPPTKDVQSAYFRLSKITFNKTNKDNDLVITSVKVSIDLPPPIGTKECTIAGDDLAALSSTWWATTLHDAIIPSGTDTITTDCALYCGGISPDTPFFASGIMTILGYEQAPNSDTQTSVKTTTYFQVDNSQ
ncbi:MAG TPA: hypothetical protein VN132_02905 [Bdellovibrio sp.]|nr:hypothetical protein [Bdellovibrio sp.]